MRVLPVIALLSSVVLLSSDAVSYEAAGAGRITRLDAETCRVEVWFIWTGEGPSFPTATCNYDYQVYPYAYGGVTILTGPFGVPEQTSPEPWSHSDGYARWIGPHITEGAFSFRPSSTLTDIAISYYVREEVEIESYFCDQPDPCPQLCSAGSFAGRNLVQIGEGSGTVYAELPQGIGEFTVLREIPVSVTDRTWSQVKAIFRE